jgi:nucleoside-diphosphate-sugar epimerase
MKNILLIGGAGYVGTVLSAHFLKKGYKITILDNFVYEHQFAIQPYLGDPDYTFIYGDMCVTANLEKASKGITDVILLSGLVGDPITKKYPNESEAINDIGVKKCIDFFDGKGIDKLVFISTCSNYGLIKENEVADENFELSPLSLYAKAKVSNEQYLLSKKGKVDYTGIVLRFATAFGLSPRMRFDLSVSEFTRDIFFGEELLVFDENTWRPYCHVRDFAQILDTVLNADTRKVFFEIFNAGGDVNNFTKKMIVDEILKHVPGGKVKYGANGSDPRNYKVSFSKIRNQLGFEPKHTVQDGIKELVDALKIGVYADSIKHKNKYGNYEIKYPSNNSDKNGL